MNADVKDAPQDVMDLAGRCLTHIKERFGIELDFQNETLSLLDYFVRDLLVEEGGGTLPPVGDHRRSEIMQLMAPTIGAYFGEVVRRMFPCRWRITSQDPQEWLLEFDHVPLRLKPVGAAAEALIEQILDDWDCVLLTPESEREALTERLRLAPPVPEDEFYAFATRIEVLQIVVDWLRLRLLEADSPPPSFFSTDDYDKLFDN